MSEDEKFLRLFGRLFFSIGLLTFVVGIGVACAGGGIIGGGVPIFIGVVFSAIGGGVLFSQIKKAKQRKKIIAQGTKYTGKIYGYVEDRSCTINDEFLINIKVHYFDEYGTEGEVIVKTGFVRGTGDYPIGATIDIIVLGSSASWVPGSVRYEHIDREEELMDDKPVNQAMVNMTAIMCNSCGASFTAAKGYVSKCPYCRASINCQLLYAVLKWAAFLMTYFIYAQIVVLL